MCFAVIEVHYQNNSDRPLKKIESKDALAKEILQLERIGTVSKVVVFHNHHAHNMVSSWVDEMYKEPEVAKPDLEAKEGV